MKKITFVVLTLTLAVFGLSAEDLVLSVDDAVEMALAENLGLKQSAIDLKTAERADRNAWNKFLPSMTASAGVSASHMGLFEHQNTSSSGFGDPGNIGLEGGLNLSLPINIGLSAGIRLLKSDYEAGLLSYEDASRQLERDVRKQYYNLLAFGRNISIQEANLELAQKRLEQARDNYENGLIPELDVLSAEVKLASLQPAMNGVYAGYDSLMLQFKYLLGLDRGAELELNGDLTTDMYNLDSEDLIRRFLPNRMDIRILDQQIQTLEYTKRASAMNYNTPTLNLGYSWGISGSNADTTALGAPIDPWTNFADSGRLSLGLQWKFDGFIPGSSTDVQLKELQDSIDNLKLTREMAVEAAGMEITKYVNDLATARKTIEANTSSVELARRNYELTEEAYQVGTRELLDVETQQQAYLEAQQQLLEAQYDYIAALLDLQYALNAEMDEFLN